jgi:hypothetical protein
MPTKVEVRMAVIVEEFLSEYRELFAHLDMNQFQASLLSFIELNYSTERLRAALAERGTYRRILAFSTITLLNKNAVMPLASFNEAANADMDRLRRETDIDVELIPAPQLPAPTEAELLEQEVRSDWRTLPMDKIRQKKSASRKYGETLERLVNAGTLESSVTALTRVGA